MTDEDSNDCHGAHRGIVTDHCSVTRLPRTTADRLAGPAVTVSVNDVDALAVPSLTVIVIEAVPTPTGVSVAVRVPPEPPNETPAAVSTAPFDDVADNVRLLSGVSGSVMVTFRVKGELSAIV